MKLRRNTLALTILLAALTGIGPLSVDMYLPSLPAISESLSASTAQVQLTISSYLAGFAAGQLVYGPLSDRYGRKPVMLCALAIYCVASLVCMLAASIDVLIAARFLQAVGGSGGIVLARAVVRDLYSGERAGRELSLMSAIMALAPVVAPLAGGVLQSAFGWRSTFIALFAFGLFTALFIWRLLPETLEIKTAGSLSKLMTNYGTLAKNKAFVAHLGIAACSFAGLFAWISGASFVLQSIYRLSALGFSLAFACASLGFLIGTSLAARLVTRIGIDRTMGLGAAALALGGLGMAGALALGLTSVASLVLPVTIYLAGMGMTMPQAIAGAMSPFPDRAGTASSMIGVSQQILAAIVGAAVGQLLGETAWPLAIAFAAMGSLTLALWIVSRPLRLRAKG